MTTARGGRKPGAHAHPQSKKPPTSSGASSPVSSSAEASPSDRVASQASARAPDPQSAASSSAGAWIVTPEMVEAGEYVILGWIGGAELGALFSASQLATEVFSAMENARSLGNPEGGLEQSQRQSRVTKGRFRGRA